MPPKDTKHGVMGDGNESSLVPPQCFVCKLENVDSKHSIVQCQTFRKMSPAERRESVFKARRCFNCLGCHLVKDCSLKCNCRKCQGGNVGKHFYMLHDSFVSTTPKGVNDVGARNMSGGGEKPKLSSRSVRVGLTKAALNRIVAARVMNPQNGKSKLIYCQQDGGSQLTLISNKLVEELDLQPHDRASFRMETMTGEKVTNADLVNLIYSRCFLVKYLV